MEPAPSPKLAAIPKVSNVLSEIRQRRSELARDKTLTLNVPGYGGHLAVRYKAIPGEELNSFMAKAAKAGGQELMETNADLLIRCCDSILIRQTPDSEPEPIDPNKVTTFSTGTLAGLLGAEANTAREEVSVMFSPDGAQPMACGQHSDALANWLLGKSEEIDKALLGE